MLYLEDILEVIENVPQEIRDRTTELRELDLGIENAQDQLEDQIKSFFSGAKKMKVQERDAVYEKIRKEYYRLLDDADEKVNVATNMHDSLERYTRKLDQELEKFKYELEADSPGITEVLEKRSLELDEPMKESQKENRYRHLANSRSSSSSSSDWRSAAAAAAAAATTSSSDWRSAAAAATATSTITTTTTSSSINTKKDELDNQLGASVASSPPASSLSYTLGQIGAGSNAIAAAASQAIAATQQLQQGRRTASLKASYDAITHGVHPTEFSIGSELANAAQTALAASALPQDQHTNSGGSNSGNSSSSSGAATTVAVAAAHTAASSSTSSGGGSANASSSGSGGAGSGGSSSTTKTSSGGSTTTNKRQKKKHQNSNTSNSANANSSSSSVSSSATVSSTLVDNGILAATSSLPNEESLADSASLESPDWTYDPNEPRYCVCNQVSYGDMVACDNPRCPVEWFHYPCVGITAPPKGKWYCPQCSASMNRRQRK